MAFNLHPLAQLLKRELLDRTKRNASYSLRAFAKALDVNHAHLSLIMRGERPVTKKLILKVSNSLGLKPFAVSEILHSNPTQIPKNIVPVALEQFELIAEWYHDAILELVRLKNFKNDYSWISRELGISIIQCKDAVDRLVHLGFLKKTSSGELEPTSPDTTTNVTTSVSSAALRHLQMCILEKSKSALENQDRTIRDHTSLSVAINKRDFEKAKKLIADFRVKLMDELQPRYRDFDEVYQLAVSFFPLTSGKREKNNVTGRKITIKKKEQEL